MPHESLFPVFLAFCAKLLSTALPLLTAGGLVGLTMGTVDRWLFPLWLPTRSTVRSTRSSQVTFWANWIASVLIALAGVIILTIQGKLAETYLPLLILGATLVPLWLMAHFWAYPRRQSTGKQSVEQK